MLSAHVVTVGGRFAMTARRRRRGGNLRGVTMMLDGVYAGDVDERFLKQEGVWRERLLPELEWDESEESRVVAELVGRSDFGDEAV